MEKTVSILKKTEKEEEIKPKKKTLKKRNNKDKNKSKLKSKHTIEVIHRNIVCSLEMF